MGKRGALRQKYGIIEDPNDCLVTCCCGPCAVCQEAREMKTRGKHLLIICMYGRTKRATAIGLQPMVYQQPIAVAPGAYYHQSQPLPPIVTQPPPPTYNIPQKM
ncbi:unnamed protein product [Didymodactylos carnosus]|uniref:Uncharacterized protein n=1 Tax=Didymodactylos carnosus TaxID=1234261 RepID=A0A815Y9J1_9BILA|nr:unnamed protein product [Didymodactylos carnosus]CAF1567362.1 unnamed protein product [Didymodactylos carnosus]CAF4227209.1 unnamed protein product [Didymodactylos carnosus]CAF4429758.1 unnamed protein product [Didymodactylos carnosus]